MKVFTSANQLRLASLTNDQLVYVEDRGGHYIVGSAQTNPATDIQLASGNYAVLQRASTTTPNSGDISNRVATTEFVSQAIGDIPAPPAGVIEAGSGSNGYFRRWSDGFLEQWGYKPSVGQGTDTTYTFPRAFINSASVSITSTMENSGSLGTESFTRARVVSNTTFSLHQSSDQAAGTYWSARGY